MLSIVGHPVAVNPDPQLRRQARSNGWEIRDFRTGRKAAKVGVPAAAERARSPVESRSAWRCTAAATPHSRSDHAQVAAVRDRF